MRNAGRTGRPLDRTERPTRMLLGASALVLATALAGCDLAAISKVSGDIVAPQYDPTNLFGGDASDDGSIVVFETEWAFDPADTNEVADIIVSDRSTGLQTRVSSASGGGAPNAVALDSSVSGDGRFVTWTSAASDIVPGDTNGVNDIFRYDRSTGETVRVSVSSAGAQANGSSKASSMSDDGELVVFESDASNLAVNDTNAKTDVFVRAVDKGTTTRWSVGVNGIQGTGNSSQPAISGDGRSVVFSTVSSFDVSDTNGLRDIYRKVGTGTTLITRGLGGAPTNRDSYYPTIDQDGTVVAFRSSASNFVGFDDNGVSDVFVWEAGTIELVSADSSGGVAPAGSASEVSVDDSGNLVGFSSSAPELTSGAATTQALVRNLTDKRTDHVSASLTGELGDGVDTLQSISGDGRSVVVRAVSHNLLPEDPNYSADLLVKAYPFPRVTSVTPSVVAPGTSRTVTIRGSGFAAPLEVSLSAHPTATVTLSAPIVVSPKLMMVQVTVPAGAAAHSHDLKVRNLGVYENSSGAETTCYGCLSVG